MDEMPHESVLVSWHYDDGAVEALSLQVALRAAVVKCFHAAVRERHGICERSVYGHGFLRQQTSLPITVVTETLDSNRCVAPAAAERLFVASR